MKLCEQYWTMAKFTKATFFQEENTLLIFLKKLVSQGQIIIKSVGRTEPVFELTLASSEERPTYEFCSDSGKKTGLGHSKVT